MSCYGEAPGSNAGTTLLFNRSPDDNVVPALLLGQQRRADVVAGTQDLPPRRDDVAVTSRSTSAKGNIYTLYHDVTQCA